jgi:hypothetical protein
VEGDDNVFVWVIIGSRDPFELIFGAFVASPANEVAQVALLVTVVELRIKNFRDDEQGVTLVIILRRWRGFKTSRKRVGEGWLQLSDMEDRMDSGEVARETQGECVVPMLSNDLERPEVLVCKLTSGASGWDVLCLDKYAVTDANDGRRDAVAICGDLIVGLGFKDGIA